MANIPVAFKLLNKASEILNELKPTFDDPDWQVRMYNGRILTITGYMHNVRQKYIEAESSLRRALKMFGLRFPSNKNVVKLKIREIELKNKIFNRDINEVAKADDLKKSALYNYTARTLMGFCYVYKVVEDWEKAYLAAIWSLQQAYKAYTSFYLICLAYSHVFETSHYVGKTLSTEIELRALAFCFRKESKLEVHEIEALVRLYTALFSFRLRLSQESLAVSVRKHLLEVPASLYLPLFEWQFVPLFHISLVHSFKLKEAVQLINNTRFLLNDESNILGPMLYYTLCVVMRLATGYCVEPFDKCENYFQGNKTMRYPQTETEYVFYTILWLWYVRIYKWESADLIYLYIGDYFVTSKKYSPLRIISDSLLLEGHLIHFVKKLHEHDHTCIHKMYMKIILLFNRMNDYTNKYHSHRIRIDHFKAYWAIIQMKYKFGFKLLKKTIKKAVIVGNKYEERYMTTSYLNWIGDTNSDEGITWKKLSEEDNIIDWNREDLKKIVRTYALPVPLSFDKSKHKKLSGVIDKLWYK